MILVARPLVSVIFEHGEFSPDSTLLVSRVLCFYAIGLTGYFSQQVLTRAYYSIQDSKLPAITAIIAVVINIILNLILIWFMGTAGLALSTAVCSYAQVIILLVILRKRFGRSILDGLFAVVIKSILAACIMSVSAMIILNLFETLPFTFLFDITRLIIVVPLSALVYFFVSKFLRNDMTGLVTGKTNSQCDGAGSDN